MVEVTLRPYVDADWPLVIDSAQRSIRKHPIAEDLSPGDIDDLLAPMVHKWNTIVATDPETGVILGWLTYRDATTVAWGFTKIWYRRHGIMRRLASHAGIKPGFDLAFPTNVHLSGWHPRFRLSALIASLVP